MYEPTHYGPGPNPKFPEYPYDKSKYGERYYKTSSTSTSIVSESYGMWVAFSPDPKSPFIMIFKSEIEALRYVVDCLDVQLRVKYLPYGTDLIKVIYE
jgi:hypothetical protein